MFLRLIGCVLLVLSVYSGYYDTYKQPIDTKVEQKEVIEKKRLISPEPKPRLLNQKLVKKYALIDNLDKALEEHISNVLSKNKYTLKGKTKSQYISELASALLKHTNGDIDLLLWLTAMARVESSFRLTANPKVSTARGYLQVIYRYHSRELSRVGISKADLSTNTSKSVLAGTIVFKKYLKLEHGNFIRATRRYRGLSVSEGQQKHYLNAIRKEKAEIQKIISQYA